MGTWALRGPAAKFAYAWGDSAGHGDPLTILDYSTETGAVVGTLTLPSHFIADPIASDSAGNLYVGGRNSDGDPQVLIYPPNSTGTATPSRTITIPNAYEPTALALDPTGVLYVGTLDIAGAAAVAVYSADSSGSDVPLRTFQLMNANDVLLDLAADAAGNIYTVRWLTYPSPSGVATYIEVYSPDASGNATPIRTITSAALVYGVAVDKGGNVFANDCLGAASCAIEEFDSHADGAALPINTINLPQLGMECWGGLVRVDSAGYIFTSFGNSSTFYIYAIGPSATGEAVPIEQIFAKTPLRQFALH